MHIALWQRPALSVVVGVFALSFVAADWPQWRGSAGQGVSEESALPTTWNADSPNVKWKARIPGDGISSPIVHGDRVYLTTAYEGVIRRTGDKILAWTSVLLAALLLIALAIARRRQAKSVAETAVDGRPKVARLDRFILGLAGVLFVAAFVFGSFDLDFSYYVEQLNDFPFAWRLSPSKWLPTYYYGALPGQPWGTWMVSGSIALLGFSVALGCISSSRSWRFISAMLVFAIAAILFSWTPTSMSQRTISAGNRVYLLIPGLLVGGWYLLSSMWSRISTVSPSGWPAALLLGSMSALIFFPPNYWKPEAGRLRVVECLDFKTGKTIWETPVVAASEERKHSGNSFATPTPCTDGKYVFADFGCVTACLDLEGRILWTATDENYFKRREYGSGASPVMTDNALVVIRSAELYEGEQTGEWLSLGASSLIAFDKATGRVKWSEQPDDLAATYATPLMWRRGDKTELIVLADSLTAYDPETGERLWRYPLGITQPVPCLLTEGDTIYVCGGTHEDVASNKILALRVTGTGKDTQLELLWEKLRSAPDVSSPVLINGRIYVVSSAGVGKCFDSATGKKLWEKRLTKSARFFPSLVAGDGKVYVTDNVGRVIILEDGEKFNILADNELEEGRCHASPALANGHILLRVGEHLYCIKSGEGEQSTSSLTCGDEAGDLIVKSVKSRQSH